MKDIPDLLSVRTSVFIDASLLATVRGIHEIYTLCLCITDVSQIRCV